MEKQLATRTKGQQFKDGLGTTMGNSPYEFAGRVLGQTALVVGARILVDGVYKLLGGRDDEDDD